MRLWPAARADAEYAMLQEQLTSRIAMREASNSKTNGRTKINQATDWKRKKSKGLLVSILRLQGDKYYIIAC